MNKKYTSLRRHAAELKRIQRSESSSSHEGPLEFFHDTLGNQGVGKLVDHLQLKSIFAAGSDIYEQEADRLAARMVDPSSDNLQLKSISSPSPSVDHSALVNDKIQQFKSGGAALDQGTRSYFEGKMGVDLSQVRVHMDQSTARFAQSINARAFTLGNHIGFGSGQFNPQSRQGKELLAHELTHVVQQGKSKNKSIDRKPAITGAADKLKLAGENSLAERIQNSDLKINFLPLKGALGYNRQGEQNTIHIDSSLKGGSSETQSKLASVIAHEAKHNEGERRESKAHAAGENVYRSLKQRGKASDSGFLKGIQDAKRARGAEKKNFGSIDKWQLMQDYDGVFYLEYDERSAIYFHDYTGYEWEINRKSPEELDNGINQRDPLTYVKRMLSSDFIEVTDEMLAYSMYAAVILNDNYEHARGNFAPKIRLESAWVHNLFRNSELLRYRKQLQSEDDVEHLNRVDRQKIINQGFLAEHPYTNTIEAEPHTFIPVITDLRGLPLDFLATVYSAGYRDNWIVNGNTTGILPNLDYQSIKDDLEQAAYDARRQGAPDTGGTMRWIRDGRPGGASSGLIQETTQASAQFWSGRDAMLRSRQSGLLHVKTFLDNMAAHSRRDYDFYNSDRDLVHDIISDTREEWFESRPGSQRLWEGQELKRTIVGFGPTGLIFNAAEAVSGVHSMTGRELSDEERITRGALAVAEMAAIGSLAAKGAKAANQSSSIMNIRNAIVREQTEDVILTVHQTSGLLNHSTSGLRTWQQANISPADALRIQNAATRTKQQIIVVGSRAEGTANSISDWDYIFTGNSAQRHSAASSVPRGVAGGELNRPGIDILQNYNPNAINYFELDVTRPHVVFMPE
jgi:hypothetical protein